MKHYSLSISEVSYGGENSMIVMLNALQVLLLLLE